MIKTEKSLFSYLIILTYKRSVYKLHSEKTLVIVSIFSLSGPAYILDAIFFRQFSNLFIHSDKGGLMKWSVAKPPLWKYVNKSEFNKPINWLALVNDYHWKSYSIVNITPVVLKPFWSLY